MIGAAAALLLADSIHTTVDFSETTEGRVRLAETVPGLPPTAPALDLFVTPRGYLELSSATAGTHEWSVLLIDSPSFYEQDALHPDRTVLVSDSGSLSAEWRTHRAHLTFKEEGSYGMQSTAYAGLGAPVAGAPPSLATIIPQTQTLLSTLSTTRAGIDYELTRNLIGIATGSYLLAGGIGAASQKTIPFQYGPRLDLSLRYISSREDSWLTTASLTDSRNLSGPCLGIVTEAGQTVPNCAPQSDILVGEEVWHHVLTRSSYAELGAGVSATRSALPPVESSPKVIPYPSAIATYAYGRPAHGMRYPGYSGGWSEGLLIQLGLGPSVDYRGLPDNRASVSLVYGYVNGRFALSEQVVAGDSLGTVYSLSVRSFAARTDFKYTLTRHFAVDAAISYGWVDQAPFGPLSSGFASLGFAVDSGYLHY